MARELQNGQRGTVLLAEGDVLVRMPIAEYLRDCGYKVVEAGYNLLAVHKSDPVVQQLQLPDMPAQSAA